MAQILSTVAGSTGSGKSVARLMGSFQYLDEASDEVKFMIGRPKMVELSVCNDIPHLLIPVVTNPHGQSSSAEGR